MTVRLFVYQYIVLLVMVEGKQTKLSDAVYAADIVPDLISHVPKHLVFVKFLNGDVVSLGNQLRLSHGRRCPKVIWKSLKGMRHTLIMLDMDAPSATATSGNGVSPLIHWLVVNIPETKVRRGLALASYTSPWLRRRSCHRRIVFLVYEQDGVVEEFYHFWQKGDSRDGFSLDEFTTMYGLGNPVAINFFIGTGGEV